MGSFFVRSECAALGSNAERRIDTLTCPLGAVVFGVSDESIDRRVTDTRGAPGGDGVAIRFLDGEVTSLFAPSGNPPSLPPRWFTVTAPLSALSIIFCCSSK